MSSLEPDVIDRIHLYFRTLGESELQAKQLNDQVAAQVAAARSDSGADFDAAFDVAHRLAEQRGLIARAVINPAAPPPARMVMPTQSLGKTPILLRRGLWYKLYTKLRKLGD